jgi:competence protein ComEC
MSRPSGVTLIAVAFGAGLATGLARFPDWGIVPAAAMLSAWLLRDEWWVAALPAFAVGALWGVRTATDDSRGCAAMLPLGEREFVVRAIEPGSGLGRVGMSSCGGVVMARWPRSVDLPAGITATVSARWLPQPSSFRRPGGTLAISRVRDVRGTPGVIDRMRTLVARGSDTLYGARAPLVDALVTGRRGELDREVRDAFAAAGLIHLLAISGFHVGLLAGWVLLLLRACGVPRHPAEGAAAAVAVGYAAFLGLPPPATRAAGLMVVAAFCRWRQRNVRPDALLGASALLVLAVDPWSISDVGAWLSVLAIGGMTLASRWSDRAIGPGPLTRSLSGSVGATLATAPVSALVFGRVAVIGVVLNLIAIPLTALVVPALVASLAAFPSFPVLARAFAASGNLLLAALEWLARVGSRAPAFGNPGAGSPAAALPWLVVLAVAWWIIHDRSTAREAGSRALGAATVVAWLTLLWSFIPTATVGRGDLTLLFVDVGQGDAALIRTPGGHWVAVDAGPRADSFDAGHRVVVPLLHRYRVPRIDVFVLSHAHRDHVGGASSLFAEIPVSVAIDPGERFDESTYQEWLAALPAEGTRWHPAAAGEEWVIDSVHFVVRHPPVEWTHRGEDLNEDSIVLEVRYRDFAGRRPAARRPPQGGSPRVARCQQRGVSRGGASGGRGDQCGAQPLRSSGAGDAQAAGRRGGQELANGSRRYHDGRHRRPAIHGARRTDRRHLRGHGARRAREMNRWIAPR